jgi:hypothetical protein
MIVFRASFFVSRARTQAGPLTSLIAGAVAMVVLPQVALAQQGGPIRLTPLPPASERPVEPGTTTETRPRPGQIVVEGLGNLGEDALGILGDESGSLGSNMWDGSRRVDATRLLENLPVSYPLREAYVLAGRVLATAARPPRATADGQGLLAPRIEKLASIGASQDALRLVNAVNAGQVPDHLAAAAVRAHFSTGNLSAGCSRTRDYTGGYGTVFWQQTLIICQVAEGDPGQAALGLDLLREQGMQVDPAFADAALGAASGGVVQVDASDTAGPVDLMTFALWRAAKAELPEALAQTISPGLLPALANDGEVDPELRLAAAHRGLRLGVLLVRDVTALYGDLQASEADMAAALTAPDTVSENRLLAYLCLAAADRADAIARSEALWEAWTRAREIGGFDVVALTTAGLLSDIPVTPDFGWLSGVATQTMLLAGEDQRARDWYRLVARQAPIVPELSRFEATLWPPMRAIGRAAPGGFALTAGTGAAAAAGQAFEPTPPRGPVPWSAARLDRWIDLAGAEDDPVPAGTVLAMLSALGDDIDAAQWRRVPLDTEELVVMPDMAVLDGLARAADDGRRAETVLYALHALGRAGDAPHDSVMAAVVRALGQVGLSDVASAIAREVMMGDVIAMERP